MRKPRSYAEIYNDLDGEIVNLFRVARDNGDQLCKVVELTPFAREEFECAWDPSDDPIEQARRTVVRAFMGFGSAAVTMRRANSRSTKPSTGFRSNSNRSGTTPAHDWHHYPESLVTTIQRLRGVVIENRDALEVIAAHDSPDALIYADPPYVADTRDPGTDYRYEMTNQEHEQLASVLTEAKGAVIVSGYPCDLYEDLYAGWTRAERAALADGAAKRTEVLWMKGIERDLFTQD
jgi:DNA adenine methylase